MEPTPVAAHLCSSGDRRDCACDCSVAEEDARPPSLGEVVPLGRVHEGAEWAESAAVAQEEQPRRRHARLRTSLGEEHHDETNLQGFRFSPSCSEDTLKDWQSAFVPGLDRIHLSCAVLARPGPDSHLGYSRRLSSERRVMHRLSTKASHN